ncbi:MAG TPA: gamma-glutamyl-gamma-aminobutyrate hydrolase family protein [Polyangia bacterium]|jgi:gamma-glutamyl-gamma-aminobutyrate hydrolase PuuD
MSGSPVVPGPVRIGVSACIMHADPTRALFKGKTLLYAEESMLQWLMAEGVLPILLPRASGALWAKDLVEGLAIDGLILQGGVDMAPESYGETPVRPEWSGDRARDVYEIELISLCLAADKPVLGICRGAQVLNVARGGTLWQDVATQFPQGKVHRDWDVYDRHTHDIEIESGSRLEGWYGARAGRINSIHHQGLRGLGRDLVVEARSVPDGLVEAISLTGGAFAYGVQWHPEFLATLRDPGLLDPGLLLRGFLDEVRRRKQ